MCTGFEIPALFSSTAAASAGSSLLTAGVAAGTTTLGTSAMLGGGLGLLEGGALLGGAALGGAALGGGLLEGAAGSAAAGSGSLLGGESLLGGDAGFLGGMGEGIGGGGLDGASSLLDGYSYGDTAAQALGGFGGGGLTAPAASPSIFDTALKYANPAMSIYSGITGLQKQKELERMARLAAAQSDPWGKSGGRTLADQQLQQLMRDPSAVAANDPAYKLRIQGAQRANAQFGQDSGAMSVAGANASTNWYNERLAQLGALAGGGVNPGTGAQIGLNGQIAANEQASQSLGSIGYGIGQMTGQGGLTPQQQLMLLQQRRSVG